MQTQPTSHLSRYVLFLDLWGTTSKLGRVYLADDADKLDALQIQRSFAAALTNLASEPYFNSIESIEHAPDTALVVSSDLRNLVIFATSFFKRMVLRDGRYSVLAIRAGIAEGAELSSTAFGSTPIPDSKVRQSSWIGSGFVESARLEKSCQKGMRLFITRELGAQLENSFAASPQALLLRTNNTKGFEHCEINWAADDPFEKNFLATSIEDRNLGEKMYEHARALIDVQDNAAQQLGSALNDMIKWVEKENRQNRREPGQTVKT